MIKSRKPWIPGVITENIEQDFETIRDLYKKRGVIYTLEVFDYELGSAIAIADYIVINMIVWPKINIDVEVERIIERMKGHEKVI